MMKNLTLLIFLISKVLSLPQSLIFPGDLNKTKESNESEEKKYQKFNILKVFFLVLNRSAQNCLTIKNEKNLEQPNQVGVPCVFPWKHNGTLHYNCITEDDPFGRFWCATKVNELHLNFGKRNLTIF